MILDETLLALSYGATAILFVLLAVYVWRRRNAPGSYYFALLMAAGAVWALGDMLEMTTNDVQLQVVFNSLSYLGSVPAPVLWVLFNVSYAQRSRQLDRRLILLWAVPIVSLLLVATNGWHHLFWTTVAPISSEPGSLLVYDYGPGMWLHVVYSYVLLVAGVVMIAYTSLRTYRHYSRQTFFLIAGSLIPIAGNVLYFLWLNDDAAFDPTSIALALCGVVYAWSMFRYGLFDVVPMARERLIAEMADGIIVLDDRGRVIDMNPAAGRMLGDRRSFGLPLETVLAPWPGLLRYCREAPEAPADVRIEDTAGARWLNVHLSPLRDRRGNVTGKLVTLWDITKGKLAESAVEESRSNFKLLFDSVDDLFLIVDAAGKIVEVNDAVTRRLGYARPEAIGTSVTGLFPPGEGEAVLASVGQVPPDHGSMGVGKMRAKDGSTIFVDTHLVPGRWDGKPVAFGIARDVTVLMRQQEALSETNRSLSIEVEERKRAEDKIARSLQEKEVMLKEIHHRVKNNMQIIISMLNLQRPAVVDARDTEIFLDCMNRIKSMALVHEKLYQSEDLADIDFEDYIRSLVSYLFSAYVSDDSKVRLHVSVAKARWNIDRAVALGLILNEIISNSLKYAFPEGREGDIFVGLEQTPDGAYVLEVGDTGVGIPEGAIGAPGGSKGTMGLRLIRILASQIDSEMTIERAGGTRYRFTFRGENGG